MPKKTDRNKPWAKRKNHKKAYRTNSFEKNKSFLIICEGETEKDYFESIPVVTAEVEAVGLAASNMYLVNYAIAASHRKEHRDKEVWCVFDFDFKGDIKGQKEEYNQAIFKALNAGLYVAHSNDAFELWFVLHYQPVQGQFLRTTYYKRLSECFSINYEKYGKAKAFRSKLYQRLQQDEAASQQQAIERAKSLHESCKDLMYADQNPCTTVYLLVEALKKYQKK